ncbi:MAG: hypothetical protein IT350_01275 [Deltaproteobacteria bacterium]|nr:hypothetical protein [Deltaproteobacteria bacterium]
MRNRDEDIRDEPVGQEDLDGLDEAERALLKDLSPDALPDPGEAYFAALGARVMNRIAAIDDHDASLNARPSWRQGFFDALRVRPMAFGIPAAVAVALVAVLVVRPTSRIPGLDWEALDTNAVAAEAKRLDPSRALMMPSDLDASGTGEPAAELEDSALDITFDFDDIDATVAGVAPPFVPVTDLSGAALSDEELTELRTRVSEALDSLKI